MIRPMQGATSIAAAREVLGSDVIGAEELEQVFGAVGEVIGGRAHVVPFAVEELRRAKESGEMLILRAPRAGNEPLTLLSLIARFPDAFDPSFLRKVGYQLKDDWGIELEPLAAVEVCKPEWALLQPVILEATRNLSYDEQEAHVEEYARRRGASGGFRRRTAIEIAFDTIVVYRTRGKRLLETSWDWSATRTLDGGYLNLGRFTDHGMQIFSYSQAVRHGQLGVCPTRDPDPRGCEA
jgi:hypothetical protein